jgi:hypothetical protein
MTGKTSQICNEIQRKVISNITGKPEFKNKEEIVETAVMMLYQSLKKEKIL